MTEHELLKLAMKEHYLNKEQIRLQAMRNIPAPQTEMRGKTHMKKRISIPLIAALAICFTTITVFAFSRMLSPKEVADSLDKTDVSAAFDKSDALTVNESITQAGYTITFLGIAEGKSLELFEVVQDKSYAVVAIANADGTAIDFQSGTKFFVSPLVKGLNPAQYNIVTMNGSYTERIVDGILYRIIECDSVEMFADRGLYLCVTDTAFYDTMAFSYNESTGSLTPNSNFSGLNALFTLPIDVAKADIEKAESYLASIFEPKAEDENDAQDNEVYNIPTKSDGTPDIDAIIERTQPIEASLQTIKADKDGNFAYSYHTQSGGMSGYIWAEQVKEIRAGETFIGSISSETDAKTTRTWYLICTLQENDTLKTIIYEENQ